MPQILFILFAILMMLSLVFLVHYYIYSRLEKAFLINKIVLISVLTFLALAFIIVSILERYFCNSFTRVLYYTAGSWYGILFLALFGFLIADLIFFILKISGFGFSYQMFGTIVLILVGLITIYSLINASILTTTKLTIESSKIKQDLKIVQISDLHLGSINTGKYLTKVVNRSNSVNPDLVLITGDFFDGTGMLTEEDLASLNNLKSKYGIYFVTGNHEMYFGINKSIELLKKYNISILTNEAKEIDGIQLIGINYPENEFETKENQALESINISKDKFSVLMYHLPSGLEQTSAKGIDLQLSGHLHKGQIFPFQIFERLMFKHISGLHRIGPESYLYISQGAGTWGPAMRFGSVNEIVEISLKKK
jgi:uncharacterized protein